MSVGPEPIGYVGKYPTIPVLFAKAEELRRLESGNVYYVPIGEYSIKNLDPLISTSFVY